VQSSALFAGSVSVYSQHELPYMHNTDQDIASSVTGNKVAHANLNQTIVVRIALAQIPC
jgi:hypothetical protein